jgi:hypothetical protein
LNTTSPSATAPAAAGIFFPQRPLLKLDTHAYTPKILQKFVETAGQVNSFEVAAHLIELNAEVEVSGRHLNRLTQMIGAELAARRDKQTEDYVHHRRQTPAEPAPKKVAVGVDGGRINTREEGQGSGVHDPGWREDKIGMLQILEGPSFTADPHPEPPKCFVDPEHVKQMVKGFVEQKGIRSYDEPEPEGVSQSSESSEVESMSPPIEPVVAAASPSVDSQSQPATSAENPTEVSGSSQGIAKKPDWPPKRVKRTCVASLEKSRTFGKMLAAEAYSRNFFAAQERSFLGDGLAYNWRIQQAWFTDFTPILDFIHALSYVYMTAKSVTQTADEAWDQYLLWMRDCWQGRVCGMLIEMRQEQQKLHDRLGEPNGKMSSTDPREVVRRAVNYLQNNASRMNYPEYRQRGLVVTTAAVESLVKEFNYRVKGTEKFWNNPDGAEAILQIRAAVLSEDDRLENYILNRPGCASRRREAVDAPGASVAA